MSNISTIYDAFGAAVERALGATHEELINPALIEQDSNLTLDAGYGFSVAEGANLLLNDASGVESITRSFELIITRRKFATKADISARKTVEKQLLEDLQLVISEIREDQTLQQSGVSFVARFSADPGIELIRPDRRNDILAIRSIFEVQYQEAYRLCF